MKNATWSPRRRPERPVEVGDAVGRRLVLGEGHHLAALPITKAGWSGCCRRAPAYMPATVAISEHLQRGEHGQWAGGSSGRTAVARAAEPDAALLARRQLPDGRADLPAGQSAAARAAAAGAHQAAAARPLGHVSRPQPDLRPPEPADQGARCQRDLPGRPGPRRPGPGRPRLPRGHLLGDLSGGLAGHGGPAAPVPPLLDSWRHPEPRQRADPGLDPRRRRARLRAVARLRRGLRQPGPDRRRRGRGRRGGVGSAGRRLEGHRASSTPPATARCCRSCTSMATRSAAPPCWAATATTTSGPSCRATATRPTSSRATIPRACTRRSPRRSTAATSAFAPSSTRPGSTASSSGRAGRPSSCARRRAGPARRRWTASPSRAPSARTRCRWRTRATTLSRLAQLEAWMRSYRAGVAVRRRRQARRRAGRPRAAAATAA